MRGKRSKQYRKLMQQYSLTFGFRAPYQVLVDAQMIQDTEAFKMDLVGGLERTLGDKVKPMITQCSMRHLYNLKDLPQGAKDILIAIAKTMERRRCNHHVLEEPLSTIECLKSVIDPKDSHTNKNRYVVASQDEAVRRFCRGVKGVPLVYVRRSVMIIEPMAESSIGAREVLNRSKFRSGLRGRQPDLLGKRKRADEDNDAKVERAEAVESNDDGVDEVVKKRKGKGPKGPNPLAVKKPKKIIADVLNVEIGDGGVERVPVEQTQRGGEADPERSELPIDVPIASKDAQDLLTRSKRKRKHKPKLLDSQAALSNSDKPVE